MSTPRPSLAGCLQGGEGRLGGRVVSARFAAGDMLVSSVMFLEMPCHGRPCSDVGGWTLDCVVLVVSLVLTYTHMPVWSGTPCIDSLSDGDPQPVPSPHASPGSSEAVSYPLRGLIGYPPIRPGVKAWGIPTGHCIMHTEQTSQPLVPSPSSPPRSPLRAEVLLAAPLRLPAEEPTEGEVDLVPCWTCL